MSKHKKPIKSLNRLTAPVHKSEVTSPKTLCAGCGDHHEKRSTRIWHGTQKMITVYFRLLSCASHHGWFFVSIDGILLVTSVLFIFAELPAIDEGVKAFIERFADFQEEIEES